MRTQIVSLFFFGVCDMLQLGVLMCTSVFYMDGHSGLSSTMVCICTTPCRGGLRFGTARLIRAEQAAPGGRSLRFQAVKGGRGGGQNKYSYWRPRRGKPNEAY